MPENVLIVDDDQNILNAMRRQFEGTLELQTAGSPERALELLATSGPFALVVTDMRMPGMNGIELLSRVKQQSPDTVKIMLTGYADLQVTVKAVNEGNIYRFISKPCSHEVLEKAIQDALSQYRLITAERELLEGTLQGSIQVLSDMLSFLNPLAFGRTAQVQRIAMAIGEALGAPNLWDLKIAAMLFPLGCVTVSEPTLERVFAGATLREDERLVYEQHSLIARGLLERIPRLETVAQIVGYQDKCFDGTGTPDDAIAGTQIPFGARILKTASDFEIDYKRTGDATRAFVALQTKLSRYDPEIIAALETALRNGLCQASQKAIPVHDLATGMVLASDIRSLINNQLMVTCGQRITNPIKNRLLSLSLKRVIGDTVLVEWLGPVEPALLAVD